MNTQLHEILKQLQSTTSSTLPTLFIGHGSPMHAVEDTEISRAWRAIGAALPRPKAILCVSAHWMTQGATHVLTNVQPRTIHDFGGFPRQLFEQQYPAQGAPEFAQRVRELAPEVLADDTWGLDHGAWAFLLHMYPEADMPVFQLSVDVRKSPAEHFALAQKLAVLRNEGVLIIGSGNVVHNLPAVRWQDNAPAYDWAVAFDATVADAIVRRDVATVVNFSQIADVNLAHPTTEHLIPLLYVLGVWDTAREQVGFFNEVLELSSMSMRSMVFYS